MGSAQATQQPAYPLYPAYQQQQYFRQQSPIVAQSVLSNVPFAFEVNYNKLTGKLDPVGHVGSAPSTAPSTPLPRYAAAAASPVLNFLDCDGVLNNATERREKIGSVQLYHCSKFAEKMGGLQVVLSTTWRLKPWLRTRLKATLETSPYMQVVGSTPSISIESDPKLSQMYADLQQLVEGSNERHEAEHDLHAEQRMKEISAYVEALGGTSQCILIDDMDLKRAETKIPGAIIVRTNCEIGMTAEIVDQYQRGFDGVVSLRTLRVPSPPNQPPPQLPPRMTTGISAAPILQAPPTLQKVPFHLITAGEQGAHPFHVIHHTGPLPQGNRLPEGCRAIHRFRSFLSIWNSGVDVAKILKQYPGSQYVGTGYDGHAPGPMIALCDADAETFQNFLNQRIIFLAHLDELEEIADPDPVLAEGADVKVALGMADFVPLPPNDTPIQSAEVVKPLEEVSLVHDEPKPESADEEEVSEEQVPAKTAAQGEAADYVNKRFDIPMADQSTLVLKLTPKHKIEKLHMFLVLMGGYVGIPLRSAAPEEAAVIMQFRDPRAVMKEIYEKMASSDKENIAEKIKDAATAVLEALQKTDTEKTDLANLQTDSLEEKFTKWLENNPPSMWTDFFESTSAATNAAKEVQYLLQGKKDGEKDGQNDEAVEAFWKQAQDVDGRKTADFKKIEKEFIKKYCEFAFKKANESISK